MHGSCISNTNIGDNHPLEHPSHAIKPLQTHDSSHLEIYAHLLTIPAKKIPSEYRQVR